MKLVLVCGPDGCVLDFDLVPANTSERDATLALLARQPIAGQLVICDKRFAGYEFEQAVGALGALVVRPSRTDEPGRARPPIGFIRQRIESIVNSFKDQLRLEDHPAKPRTGPGPASPPAPSRPAPPSTSPGKQAPQAEPSPSTRINRSSI
jgi:Transposase DDE domain